MNLIKKDIQEIIKSIEKEIPAFEGKTILISGGVGFLGNFFVATLLALNDEMLKTPCKVIVLDNLIIGSKQNFLMYKKDDPNLTFIEHDIRKPIPSNLKADYIIHAAGIAAPVYYRKFPIETIEVAVNGTKNLLEFAKEKKVLSMLHFSSSEIYGDPTPNFIPTREDYRGNVSATGPRACYDESKRLGETLVTVYHQLYNIPVKTVRPFNVYGPTMKIDDYRVITNFMVKGVRGEILTVYDQGNQTRTFCYITDAIAGFLKVLISGKNGEVYNVGNDSPEIGMMDLAIMISKLLTPSAQVKLVNHPESYPSEEPKRRCPDLTKIKTELGFEPKINLKEGLSRTLVWYQEQLKNEN